jgi:hypothetical protein
MFGRFLLVATCAGLLPCAELTPAQSDIADAVYRLVLGSAAEGDSSVAAQIRSIRLRLRGAASEPMSEDGPAILSVRAPEANGETRATSCAYLVRVNSVAPKLLGAYTVTLSRAAPSRPWRIASIIEEGAAAGAGRCGAPFGLVPAFAPVMVK